MLSAKKKGVNYFFLARISEISGFFLVGVGLKSYEIPLEGSKKKDFFTRISRKSGFFFVELG